MIDGTQAIDSDLITEEWLAEVGFKWHQLDRQPSKHWLLWLGPAIGDGLTAHQDLGLELARSSFEWDSGWFCWLRSDTAGRYSRFLHIRRVGTKADVIRLVEALTGQKWNPENHLYGSAFTPERAARIRAENERMDNVLRESSR